MMEAVLDGVAAALGPRAPSTPVKLITFRPNGVRGALAGRPSPTPEQMAAWRAYALSAGLGARPPALTVPPPSPAGAFHSAANVARRGAMW